MLSWLPTYADDLTDQQARLVEGQAAPFSGVLLQDKVLAGLLVENEQLQTKLGIRLTEFEQKFQVIEAARTAEVTMLRGVISERDDALMKVLRDAEAYPSYLTSALLVGGGVFVGAAMAVTVMMTTSSAP